MSDVIIMTRWTEWKNKEYNAELTCTLGMNYPLWYALPIKVSKFIKKLDILQ
jgi:hypothetical protein